MKLTNQEIWLAYPNLMQLYKLKIPFATGIAIGLLLFKLQQPYTIIENERQRLLNRYGVSDGKVVTIAQDSPNAGDFAVEFGGLLTVEWPEEFEFEKVKLPSDMLSYGAGIQNAIIPLREYFIE